MKKLNEEFSEILVEEYVYRKVLVDSVKVKIPRKPIFYHKWNVKIVVGIFPRFYPDTNEVYELRIMEIESSKITTTFVRTNPRVIEDIILYRNAKNKISEDRLIEEVVLYLKDSKTQNPIDSDIFYAKYNQVINNFSEIVGKHES